METVNSEPDVRNGDLRSRITSNRDQAAGAVDPRDLSPDDPERNRPYE